LQHQMESIKLALTHPHIHPTTPTHLTGENGYCTQAYKYKVAEVSVELKTNTFQEKLSE